jgi:PAS domain S-box-containing protein
MKLSSAKSKVLAVVLLACILPSLISLVAYFLFGSARHIHEPLHECLELSGSWIALAVAMGVWLHAQREQRFLHLQWVAAALVGMGLLDGAHALAPVGVAWYWLRNVATLVGGSLFALVWLPLPAQILRRRFFIFMVVVLAVVGAVAIWCHPGVLPVPWGPAGYSFATNTANALGGLGFVASALFFVRRYLRQTATEDLIFASNAMVFATASLLFWFSHPWAADWWVWHGFRLLAYGAILIAAYQGAITLDQKITGQAQELELHTAELIRLAAIVESSEDAIISESLDGVITTWNEGAVRLFEFTASEAVGQPMTLVVPPDRHEEAQNLLRRVLQGEYVPHLETVRLRKDGRRVDVSLKLSAVKDMPGEITGTSSIERDITDRIARDQEISRLNQELQHRVSELTTLNRELEAYNYSVAHDLRAPLRHIDGFSKILLEEHGASLPDDARRCASRISEGARRMGQMVDELLDLSRASRCELSKQATALSSLVAQVLEELGPEVQDRKIEWRIGDLPFVECDPTLMRQVFANLLGNAVKFTRHRKPAVIEVGQATSEEQTVLFVRDNGVGFNMKYADKLFGVFQRLHRLEDFEGTGIGLVTVQRIIHKHGGRIWAEAELEKGATFNFTLEPPAQPPLEQPNLEPTTILVGET